jgi:hypothetical protein
MEIYFPLTRPWGKGWIEAPLNKLVRLSQEWCRLKVRLLNRRNDWSLISFVGGNDVEGRLKQPKISTRHKRCIRED